MKDIPKYLTGSFQISSVEQMLNHEFVSMSVQDPNHPMLKLILVNLFEQFCLAFLWFHPGWMVYNCHNDIWRFQVLIQMWWNPIQWASIKLDLSSNQVLSSMGSPLGQVMQIVEYIVGRNGIWYVRGIWRKVFDTVNEWSIFYLLHQIKLQWLKESHWTWDSSFRSLIWMLPNKNLMYVSLCDLGIVFFGLYNQLITIIWFEIWVLQFEIWVIQWWYSMDPEMGGRGWTCVIFGIMSKFWDCSLTMSEFWHS